MSKRPNISDTIQGLTSLGAFVEVELSAMEREHGLPAREAGERVLESLLSIEGTPVSMAEGELRERLIAGEGQPSAVDRAIGSLLNSGLIARPAPDTLRLGSNALAAALEQRFRDQRTLRREALALIRDKYRQKDLLTEKELNRVEPERPYLNLTAEEKNFLRSSEQAVKRRKWALWIVVTGVILALLWLSWNWYNESTVANREKVRADEKAKEALISAEAADSLRLKALELAGSLRVEKDTSEARRLRAELNEAEARLQAYRAQQAARQAQNQEAIARRLADTLSMQLDTVSKYRALAEAGRQAAVDSAASAEKARQQAEGLALILKSRNIALSVPQFPQDSVVRAAVLAYQAYRVNKDNSQGDVFNSDIYKTLFYALRALRNKLGIYGPDVIPAHKESVADIIRLADGAYLSAGTDGQAVQFWTSGKGDDFRGIYPEGYSNYKLLPSVYGEDFPTWTLGKKVDFRSAFPPEGDIKFGFSPAPGGLSLLTKIYPEAVQKLAASPDGRWALACPRLGHVDLYDLQNQVIHTVKYPGIRNANRWGATDAIFIPEEDVFLIVGHAGNVHKLAVANPSAGLKPLFAEDHPFRTIGQDNNALYLLDKDGFIAYYPFRADWRRQNRIHTREKGRPLDTGPSGQLPASITEIHFLGGGYSAMEVGDTLFVGGKRSGEVFLAKEAWLKRPHELVLSSYANQWHQAAVIAARFSPDGHWLSTLSRDGVASIIDIGRYLKEGAAYQPIVLDFKNIYATAICFSHDSEELLLGVKDGGIYRFFLDPELYARQLCELLHLEGNTVDWETPWKEDFREEGAPKKCY